MGLCAIEIQLETLEVPDYPALVYLNLSENKNLRKVRFKAALAQLIHLDLSDGGLVSLKIQVGFEQLAWLDLARELVEAYYGGSRIYLNKRLMKDQKEVLHAYLEAKLAERGMTLDTSTLNQLNEQVVLVSRPTNESEETRTITQKIDREGKHTAQSFKLYNITQVSFDDLFSFAGQYAGLAIFEDTVKKLIYGFAMLIIDFIPN